MTEDFSSALWPFHVGPVLALRPRRRIDSPEGWVLDVSAAELVGLVEGAGAARLLRARRMYLGDTRTNRVLAEILRRAPEEFGAVGAVVLGADAVELSGGDCRGFGGELRVLGVECIDGFQRLMIIAGVAAALGVSHVGRATVRLEVRCGPAREVARRLHRSAGDLVNASTAQDGLIHCPHIDRLVRADWEETGSFEPRRGVVPGPRRRLFTMPEVTRALACLSPSPEAVNLVATDEGLEAFWAGIGTPLYLSVFHDHLSPLGVVRAVEAWGRALGALRAMPGRLKSGAGHLIRYAPELICWAACREVLPLDRLHEESSVFDWDGVIRDRLPAHTQRTAERLVRQYEGVREARGSTGTYVDEAPQLDVWLDVLAYRR